MRITLVLILTFTLSNALSQTRIAGKITGRDGLGIPLANIILLNTYDGTTSDPDGNFMFTTTEKGDQTLIVKFIGFREHQQLVHLDGTEQLLKIALEETINELEAVTISAGSFTASDESRRTVLRAVDIATTAGATADIAGALNTLPGTQKVGETGRIFVRGGEGHEAQTFVDGLLVVNPYSPSAPNTPSRGRFLPFMFKGTSFSTGGYSSEYGQALSSALVLDSKDKSETTRTDIGILSVGGDLAHTQAWDHGSAAAKVQYTNLIPYFSLIDQQTDWINAPVSLEGSTAFRQEVGKDGIVKFFGNFNRTNFSLYRQDIDDQDNDKLFDLSNRYTYLNAFYKDPINDDWLVRGGLSYTSINDRTGVDDIAITENESGIHGKAVLEGSLSDKIALKTGAEIIRKKYDRSYSQCPVEAFEEIVMAGFAETDIYTSNNFVARSGGRFEYNTLQHSWSLDPRVSLAYKTGAEGQMSLAYGKFRQSAANEWLRVNTDLSSEKADHYILNYQRVDNNRTLRVETYYKQYANLVKVSGRTGVNNNGHGYARGFDLFWRDNETFSNADYWLSYTFLDTEREYLNFPYAATPAFASRHNFSAVGKYFVRKIKSQMGMTYSFASPRPYNNPNTTGFNSGRTPAYHDLSFNWSYLPRPSLIIYFSCTNLLGRDNIFGYQYGTQLNQQGVYNELAIRQSAKRFLFVGIFLTLSRDKSVNQLPAL
jgi:hypothetical protein